MAKAKKITEEELAAVQVAVSNLNNLYMSVGRAIVEAVKSADNFDVALKEQQKGLEDKYGSVTINLQSGEYEEVVEEAEEVA
jgi:hypothetical protein